MFYHHLLFISMTEILFIAFVAFLMFGTKKIPEVARGLGKGYKEFQKAADEIKNEINKITNDVEKETSKFTSEIRDEVNKVTSDIKNETDKIKNDLTDQANKVNDGIKDDLKDFTNNPSNNRMG